MKYIVMVFRETGLEEPRGFYDSLEDAEASAKRYVESHLRVYVYEVLPVCYFEQQLVRRDVIPLLEEKK